MTAGYRLLLVDVYWLDEAGERYGPGYVLLDRGRVAALEPGEPGEEEQYAEMVAGGPGRLVVPGFAGLAAPELYILRAGLSPGEAWRALLGEHPVSGLLEGFGPVESYYATLIAAWEAALNGITRLVVLSVNPAAAAQAVSDAGLAGLVLAADESCGATPLGGGAVDRVLDEARRRGADLARVKVAPLSCGRCGGAWCLSREGLTAPGGGEVAPQGAREWLLPITAPWAMLYTGGGAAWRLLVATLHRAVEPSYEPLAGMAHLSVLDLSQPPGWCPARAASPSCLGPLPPRVETLVAEGRVVVDGGESLYAGSTAAAEAARRLGELAEKAARTG